MPIDIDAIAFWCVRDTKKAILEVESYYQAIVMAVQTALRDIVGVHTLAETSWKSEKIRQTLKKVLEEKMQAWGMSVQSIEMRDITIPDNLPRRFVKAGPGGTGAAVADHPGGGRDGDRTESSPRHPRHIIDNPVALQLRAMNILYEGCGPAVR